MRGMAAALRRRGAGDRPDLGFTLVEMVVSMSIGALLLALITAFTVRELRTIDYADKRSTASSQLATTQDTLGQQIKTMVAFPGSSSVTDPSGKEINGPVVATAENLGFYSFVTNASVTGTSLPPVQENWFWVQTSGGKRQLCTQTRARTRSSSDTGKLVVASPDLSIVGNRTCRLLISDLASVSSSNPVFQYVTGDYDPLSGAPTTSVVVSSPATDSSTLRAIYVDLRLNSGTGTHPAVLEKATLVQLLNKIGKNP